MSMEKYAELAIKVGVNLKTGQDLLIKASIEIVEFVRVVVKKAYASGAKNVDVLWDDDDGLTRLRYERAAGEAFMAYPVFKAKAMEDVVIQNKAILILGTPSPSLLEGIDSQKIANQSKAASLALHTFYKAIRSDKISWTIIDVPTRAWAKKVFPALPSEDAQMEALWRVVFIATRTDLENPVHVWKEHSKNLTRRAAYLNKKKFKFLHLRALGTDLTLALPEKHLWYGGEGHNEVGRSFCANIPTEEIFTLPLKTGVNGVVTNTMPLIFGGKIIDGFTLTFEAGRIVDFHAETGYEQLKQLIETDEGSCYLGEIALVPYDTPISKLNMTFYSTLFDENGRVHLGLGEGSASCLEGGKSMSEAELVANGANRSSIRVCFVIGSEEMNIDGIYEGGRRMPLFRKGCWIDGGVENLEVLTLK